MADSRPVSDLAIRTAPPAPDVAPGQAGAVDETASGARHGV
jgi:hypothetical protein